MLTPEGFTLPQLQSLADSMLARGVRVLSLSFHSPSLAAGHTPFVRTEEDRKAFTARVLDFLRWFASRRGGRFVTASEVHGILTPAALPAAVGADREVA